MAVFVLIVGALWWISEARKGEASPDEWPAAVERRFIDSCIATGGNEAYCGCALKSIQNSISFERFAVLEQWYLATGQWPDEMVDAAVSCLAKGNAGAAPAPITQPPRPTLSPQQVAGIIDETTKNTFPEFTTKADRWDIYRDDVMGELLCFTISYQNVGRVDGAPPTTEFSAVGPSGRVLITGFRMDSDPLAAFQSVVPGTNGTFQACFVSNGERGTFVLRREDVFFGHDEEWKISVTAR